jgi:hypothetical protein
MRIPRKSIEVAENAVAKAFADFDHEVSSKVFCIRYDPKLTQFFAVFEQKLLDRDDTLKVEKVGNTFELKRASEVVLGRGWGRQKLRQAKRPNHANFELAASKCQPEACNSIKPIHTTTLHPSFHSVASSLSSYSYFHSSSISPAAMSEVQVLKPDKDFSKEVDKHIPEAEQLAQVYYCDVTSRR